MANDETRATAGPEPCVDGCSAVIREVLAEHGVDVTASTAPPLIHNEFVVDAYECPHGVLFWLEPTSEQIAQWAAEAAS